MKHQPDKNSEKIRHWLHLKPRTNPKLLGKFLVDHGQAEHGITHVLSGKDFAAVRKQIVAEFKIQ